MLLKKLEAYGFKSFADRTEIEFGKGITAIVGPNGSGKSNISDAIRWALGEQSIRMLRGTKMEDVIFAGSSGRKALGVAEVSLTFDNTDGILPIDYNEVIITRRVFRSGDSEYYINKTSCRLKDIHELLADTGLGREAMAVISQNKIDEVLNSRPEDRRLIFEEAAGITKYKNRKREALRKMDETTQNIIRVTDITSEIELQLSPMAESAERTRQYNELHNELVSYQVTILANKLTKAEKMVESARLQQLALTDNEIAATTTLTLKETEKEKHTDELASLEQELASYLEILQQTNTELERIDGKVGVLEERIVQGQKAEQRLLYDIERVEQQYKEVDQQLADLDAGLIVKRNQENQIQAELTDLSGRYQEIITAIGKMEKQIEDNQEKAFDYLQELVSEKNQLSIVERDLLRMQARQASFSQEQNEHTAQIAQIALLEQQERAEEAQLRLRIESAESALEELVREQKAREVQINEKNIIEKQLLNQRSELFSRQKILSSMQHEYEGFGRGIKSILKSNQNWRNGICGAVAEILTVPDRYVTAIEIALGGALQHIITRNDDVAKQAINFLKQNSLGRVTFLPLNTVKARPSREFEVSAARTSGSHGFASDLVTCQPEYRDVIQFLLGRTIVVENIEEATKIARQSNFQIRVVTLEGDLVNPGGSITGGSLQRKEAGFLSRHNEIETIQNNIAIYNQKITAMEADLEATKQQLSETTEKMASIQSEKQENEVKIAETGIRLEKISIDSQRIALALATLENELADAAQEEIKLNADAAKARENINRLESRDIQHKEQSSENQQQLKGLTEERETYNDILTETKIALTALQQEINAIIATRDQLQKNAAALFEQNSLLRHEVADYSVQIQQANAELGDLAVSRAGILETKRTYEGKNQVAYQSKMNLLAAFQIGEKEIKELRRKQTDIQNRLHEMEMLAAKYDYEMTHSLEQLREQFNMSIDEAMALCLPGNHNEMAAAIRELESQIAVLGPINAGAIEEYARLQERYGFLCKQREDLVSAQGCLEAVLRDIDQMMSKQFNKAFAQINEHFGDTFGRLFGGGRAYLSLMEPDNVLNTGVEIFVQPPGKKQQNLALLSGGERALTVIALLFAFLTYRPAPFCVVDEIDAALDEANVRRLSEFLRDYALNTQFIVVTHRKATMEVADILHGVTIEESGVSRLLSVKLTEKAG